MFLVTWQALKLGTKDYLQLNEMFLILLLSYFYMADEISYFPLAYKLIEAEIMSFNFSFYHMMGA